MLYALTKDFIKINETTGTVQNSSKIRTLEMSDKNEVNTGIFIPPLRTYTFIDTEIYLRCVDGEGEARVVPFLVDTGSVDVSVASGTCSSNLYGYTLQPATTDSLGGVIAGDGLSIGADGRIDVTIQGGNNFTLTAATEDSLGGIMVGKNVSINNGTLSSFFYLDTIPCTIDGAMWLEL